MEEPKDKTADDQVTENDQTNLNMGDKDSLSTKSPNIGNNETSESSNRGEGPSGEHL